MLAAHAREAIRVRDKATRVRRSQMRAAGQAPAPAYEHDGDFVEAVDGSEDYDLHPDCNVDEACLDHIDRLLAEGLDEPNAGAADQCLADGLPVPRSMASLRPPRPSSPRPAWPPTPALQR